MAMWHGTENVVLSCCASLQSGVKLNWMSPAASHLQSGTFWLGSATSSKSMKCCSVLIDPSDILLQEALLSIKKQQ